MARTAYAQADGPPSLQLVNHGKVSPYLPWHQTYGMPATLDWLNNHVLEDWRSICHLSTRGMRRDFWTIPPAYDHWYLDCHFPLVV